MPAALKLSPPVHLAGFSSLIYGRDRKNSREPAGAAVIDAAPSKHSPCRTGPHKLRILLCRWCRDIRGPYRTRSLRYMVTGVGLRRPLRRDSAALWPLEQSTQQHRWQLNSLKEFWGCPAAGESAQRTTSGRRAKPIKRFRRKRGITDHAPNPGGDHSPRPNKIRRQQLAGIARADNASYPNCGRYRAVHRAVRIRVNHAIRRYKAKNGAPDDARGLTRLGIDLQA